MQRLLILLATTASFAAIARADSTVTNLPVATIPLPANAAIYVDQGGVDTQLTGDMATALGLNASAANTIRGNFTNSSGNDAANAMPSCPASGTNHLNYVSGTGFVCGTNAVSGIGLATTGASPANPATTTSATYVMMGLGSSFTITPGLTGKVHFEIAGNINVGTGGINSFFELQYGTGAAPANGAAVTGTTCGQPKSSNASAGTVVFPFVVDCYATGLTVSTAYWADLAVHASSGAVVTITNVDVYAEERP